MNGREDLKNQSTKEIIKRHYEADYRTDFDDSPDETRRDVNRAIMQALRDGRVHPRRILNIGSGPQLLERVLQVSYRDEKDITLLKGTQFVTMDLTHIQANQLKAQGHPNVLHVRAGGEKLPFAPGTFGMVVSNMAMDMMPRASFSETSQALSEGGVFVFTFHHPDMMRKILAETKDPDVREIVSRMMDDRLYFETEEEIRSALAAYGLVVEEVTAQRPAKAHLSGDRWWFVRGVKGR